MILTFVYIVFLLYSPPHYSLLFSSPTLISVAEIKYPEEEQLTEERIYFSSLFQVTVCYCREVTLTEVCSSQLHHIHRAEANNAHMFTCLCKAPLLHIVCKLLLREWCHPHWAASTHIQNK